MLFVQNLTRAVQFTQMGVLATWTPLPDETDVSYLVKFRKSATQATKGVLSQLILNSRILLRATDADLDDVMATMQEALFPWQPSPETTTELTYTAPIGLFEDNVVYDFQVTAFASSGQFSSGVVAASQNDVSLSIAGLVVSPSADTISLTWDAWNDTTVTGVTVTLEAAARGNSLTAFDYFNSEV